VARRFESQANDVDLVAGLQDLNERESFDALRCCVPVASRNAGRLQEDYSGSLCQMQNDLYQRNSSSTSWFPAQTLYCSWRVWCRSCVDRLRRKLVVPHYYEGDGPSESLADRRSSTGEFFDFVIVLAVHFGSIELPPVDISLAAGRSGPCIRHREWLENPQQLAGNLVTEAEYQWGRCAVTLLPASSEEKPAICWT